MSCESLTQQSVRTSFTMGALPEGFCPKTLQEMGEAIVARIISSTGQSFSTFVVGPNPPSSNVGPWLKDCEVWFVWDDATASYRPMRKGGFDSQEYRTASGTFIVPDFIFKIKVSLWGAGGGGGGGGTARGGGGGGGFVDGILNVIPGQVIPIVIGTGGAGVVAGAGAAGGNSTFLTLTAGGGGGGSGAVRGAGGTAAGGTVNMVGGAGEIGVAAGENSGNGGNSSRGGSGGTSSNVASSALSNGIVPGGGGGGSENAAYGVGTGAGGAVEIMY